MSRCPASYQLSERMREAYAAAKGRTSPAYFRLVTELNEHFRTCSVCRAWLDWLASFATETEREGVTV